MNFISNLIDTYRHQEKVHLDKIERALCPGVDCIMGSIHLDCVRYKDSPIVVNYDWKIVHAGLDERSHAVSHEMKLLVLYQKAGGLEEQTLPTCSDAETKIHAGFMQTLRLAEKEMLEKRLLNKETTGTPRTEFRLNHVNIGLSILAIALVGFTVWKCYRWQRSSSEPTHKKLG